MLALTATLCCVVPGPLVLELGPCIVFIMLARCSSSPWWAHRGGRAAGTLDVKFRHRIGSEKDVRDGQGDRQWRRHDMSSAGAKFPVSHSQPDHVARRRISTKSLAAPVAHARVLHLYVPFPRQKSWLSQAIFRWGDSSDPSERRRKRTRSAEAECKTDFGNRQCRTCQQCFASLDPLLNDIAMRRYSK